MYLIQKVFSYFSRYGLFNNHNFKMVAKRTSGDNKATAYEESLTIKLKKTLPKKNTDSFQCRVSFKHECKGFYHVEAIKNNKCKILCLSPVLLPSGMEVCCFHQGGYC